MFSFTEVDHTIRALAKTDYWQGLYAQSKEVSGIQLFQNQSNFTTYQMSFLANLSFYSGLYMDIAMGEVSNLVTDNELYEDCYWYFKSQERKSKMKIAGIPSGEHGTVVQRIKDDKEVITNKNIWNFTKSRK